MTFGLGEHGVEVLGLVRGDLGLVVVHEPGVVGVRHAVELAVGAGDGVDFQIAVLFLDLLLGVGAQLSDATLFDEGAQLIGSEHVDIRGGSRIGGDVLGSVALRDDIVLPRDLVFRVSLGEVLFDLTQPIGVLGLIFLWSPHAQRDGFGARRARGAVASGAARRKRYQHGDSSRQSDCLLPIDLH